MINKPIFRETLLIILLCIAVFVASTGGVENQTLSTLLEGISISVLATVVSLYFLQDIGTKQEINSAQIKQAVSEALGALNQQHFNRVDRNMDIGEKFWLDLVDELDSSVEPVWFVGTRLSWWLKTGVYREPLRAKFAGRLRSIVTKSDSATQASKYMTYIFLADPNAIPKWKAYFQEIIDEVISNKSDEAKKKARTLCWSKIKIHAFPLETIRYSLVLCGDRLIVTNYVSSGRSDDSPTFDIKQGSVVHHLYTNDLKLLKEKADSNL